MNDHTDSIGGPIEDRFIELETKLAYCEDLVQRLNDALSSQQRQLDELRLSMATLTERVKTLAQPAPGPHPGHERPPHY